jgi:hypothetical protein
VANLPVVIRSAALTIKSSINTKLEHSQALDLRDNYTFATNRKHDQSNEWLRAINLQRYACLIYGSTPSSPKPGQKVVVIA